MMVMMSASKIPPIIYCYSSASIEFIDVAPIFRLLLNLTVSVLPVLPTFGMVGTIIYDT
jgi:hypothetical protein